MAVTLKGNNGTYEGTSEDSKPLDVPVNTEFNELDTGKTYYFDGETWNEEPPCEGSGFTPTAEQLAAMNSGINAEDVEQITTNKNNISLNTAEITGQQNATTDTVAGRGYAIINGQRLYMGAAQMPERIGDIWLDGATARESEYLLTANPLCGIGDYKDTLNLATGECTRKVREIILNGTEPWSMWSLGSDFDVERFYYNSDISKENGGMCSHFPYISANQNTPHFRVGGNANMEIYLYVPKTIASSVEALKSWIAQENANGTPIKLWCILLIPTTETITVPSGNVGTAEGYLIQDGTPTPTAPIYPMANQVPVWG